MTGISQPTPFFFTPTKHVPNSKLPVLVYKDVLPQPRTESAVKQFLESNQWIHGGTWNAVPRHHFHPNTHECYAIILGFSELLIGVGPLDSEAQGTIIRMNVGDVIVLPAGVSHCSRSSSPDYKYVGAYPKGAPKWKNEYCRDQARLEFLTRESSSVTIPDWDPVNGYLGPLQKLWVL